MRVVYARTALDQLDGIATLLLARDRAAAARVEDDRRAEIARVGDFPLSGRRQDEGDVRKVVSPGYRYRIFYAVDQAASVITLLSILHPARME